MFQSMGAACLLSLLALAQNLALACHFWLENKKGRLKAERPQNVAKPLNYIMVITPIFYIQSMVYIGEIVHILKF